MTRNRVRVSTTFRFIVRITTRFVVHVRVKTQLKMRYGFGRVDLC